MNQEVLETVLDAPQIAPGSGVVPLRADFRWQAMQVLADFATVFVSSYATYLLYLMSGVGLAHYAPEYYAQLDLVLAGIAVFAMHGRNANRSHIGLLRIEWVCQMLRAVASAVLMILAASFFLHLPPFSRIHMLLAGPAVVVALLIQRFASWRLQERIRSRSTITTPVLVYGAGETGRLLAQHLLDEHAVGLKPCAFLDDDTHAGTPEVRVGAGPKGLRLPVVGGEESLGSALARTGARAVFLAMPTASPQRIAQIVAKLDDLGVPFYAVPSSGNLLFSSLSFGQVGGIPVYARRAAASNPLREAFGRVIDVIGAAVLLACTGPVLIAGAVAVRLDSIGPVFFRQTRIGLGGRAFTIYKLRTMRDDTPAYAEHPRNATDSRITSVGRLLRRTCIDELPQLWNVLRGEMSLVGPRPEMPQIVQEYSDLERQRLTVNPGLTGLWQISADRAFRIHDNMQYDLYYIEHRSTTLDLAILLMTPFVMMARDRAI